MTPETFLAEFGHFADAPKEVQKLRELILQLAVQGKLVAQDPGDEPTDVILDEIADLKRQLLKTKKLRKTKQPIPYDKTGLPDLPSGWAHSTLYDLGEIAPRNTAEDETEHRLPRCQ